MKAQRLVVIRNGTTPLKVLGVVEKENDNYFIFKCGSGRRIEVSRSSQYTIQETDEEFKDNSQKKILEYERIW